MRARLARQICAQHTSMNGYLPLIALSAKWEQAFAELIIGTGEERSLAMQPSRLSEFISLVRERFEQAAREGEAPVLVTSGGDPAVRALAGGAFPRSNIRDVAVGNPPPRPAQDGREHLTDDPPATPAAGDSAGRYRDFAVLDAALSL